MARLWKNGENGTGENGKFIPFFSLFSPIFLPFPNNFTQFFYISHNIFFGNFSQFPISPHILPHVSIFSIFLSPCG